MELRIESTDLAPPGEDDTTSTSDGLACIVCGTALTYQGRGPKPKYCEDHRAQKPAQKRSGTNIDSLISQIEQFYLAVSTGLTFIPPTQVDGMIVASGASSMAESWRPLIQRDPKVRKFWERICTGGGWGTVVFAHAMIAMSIAQNHNVTIPGLSKVATDV